MAKTRDEIITAIDNHLQKSGKRYYSEFYIGITNNIQRRLFDEHNVQREGMWWIYETAISIDDARSVEKHYLDLGMRGGDGGGDETSTIVYCYTVTPTTIE